MKKILSLILAILTLLFCFVGCNDFKKPTGDEIGKGITTITDFSKFADMTRETDKIEVEFDNYSGYPFYFTIEDQEDIEEIMNIIFSATFTKMGTEPNGGDHTSITIIQGEKEYKMHAFMNKEGQYYYSFSTTELQLKINELAREAGAFDGVE